MKKVKRLTGSVTNQFITYCDGEVTWFKVIEFNKLNPKLQLTKEQLRELFRNKFNED